MEKEEGGRGGRGEEGGRGGGGVVKRVQCRPQIYQLILSRVIDVNIVDLPFYIFCCLTLFVCSVPVEEQDQCPCIPGILLLYLYQEKDEITKKLRPHVSGYF